MAESINIDVEEDENYSLLGTCRVDRSNQKVITLERFILAMNFILELPSAVFDQLSSKHKPQYALLTSLDFGWSFILLGSQIDYRLVDVKEAAIYNEYGHLKSAEKSDVFSLGVVLLELLVLDPRVGPPELNEAEAVVLVAYTALRCVNLEAKDRPSMTDVVVNLEKALFLCNGRMEGEVLNSLDRSKIEEGTLKES
ncbi:hypothetical protein GH714_013513 [Hevea brasiliensis]|uniref:Serine-threonine/tyrosine-protein kinase catalytic domain-containing protein n=1 Tax=Hevea brasiliensis TaxID=3981 RepID=A0A6A6N2Q8_HEVBR|nr:hypothetical protein GH714_013513 [Hevea brasiliensis]